MRLRWWFFGGIDDGEYLILLLVVGWVSMPGKLCPFPFFFQRGGNMVIWAFDAILSFLCFFFVPHVVVCGAGTYCVLYHTGYDDGVMRGVG